MILSIFHNVFAICISSLVMYLFRSIVLSLNRVFFLLLSSKFVCIFWIQILYQAVCLNYFLPVYTLSFHFFKTLFSTKWKLFSVNKIQHHFFHAESFCILYKNSSLNPGHIDFPLCFS